MANAGMTAEQIESVLYGDGTQTGALAKNYKALEAACGGLLEYLNPGEKAVLSKNERPSGNVSMFSEWAQVASGAALGLGRARATGKAEASYTAFRGEELMTWETFRVEQKRLERRVVDFCVFKAISWAEKNGAPWGGLPAGWNQSVSVEWTQMEEVDQFKAASAVAMRLKNGERTFQQIIGPSWREHFAQLSAELEAAKEMKIPLGIFGTSAGGAPTPLVIDPSKDTDDPNPDQTDEDTP